MANPGNALGTNGAFGGRTSVNAFNDVLGAFSSRGVLSGWGCEPGSGLTVTIGGNGAERDVAIAEDANGNKTTVNNISQAPIEVEMNAAPASNSRVDAIVAYIEASPSSEAITDNYDAVNLLVVSGAASSSPSLPNDSQIRAAITADGASGSTAYYVVLASVTIAAGTTDIDATMISDGPQAQIGTDQIADNSVTANKIDFTTLSIIVDSVPANTSKTLNLTPGRWLVFAWCTILTTNSTETPKLAFMLNNNEYLTTFAGNTNQAIWENLAIEDLVTISNGDVFKVLTDRNVSNPTARSRIVAIKLG